VRLIFRRTILYFRRNVGKVIPQRYAEPRRIAKGASEMPGTSDDTEDWILLGFYSEKLFKKDSAAGSAATGLVTEFLYRSFPRRD